MNLFLTSDESYGCDGLAALERLACHFGNTTIVAPIGPNSFSGHRVTVHRPLQLAEIKKDVYSLTGTPVDCVRIGISSVLPEVSWVISGINTGSNLGMEVYASATVAAAREAAVLGYRAISISHVCEEGRPINWNLAVKRLCPVFKALLHYSLERGSFWNINLPHPRHDEEKLPIEFRPLDFSPLKVEYERRGNQFLFKRQLYPESLMKGYDVESCLLGNITVSRLCVKGPAQSVISSRAKPDLTKPDLAKQALKKRTLKGSRGVVSPLSEQRATPSPKSR